MHPSLRVALDAREASDPVFGRGTGVGRYVYNLLVHLPPADRTVRYTAFVARPARLQLDAGIAEVRLPGFFGAAHWALPWAARKLAVQLIHGTANTIPLVLAGMPAVVTLHDLAIYRHPDFFPQRQTLSTRVLVPRSLRRAAAIICPSQHTADDAAALFDIARERLKVIPHGFNGAFGRPVPPPALAAVRTRYRVPERYVLFNGTLQPRKNLETALFAVAEARRRDPVALVVVGARGWRDQPALDRIQSLGLQDAVHLLGYVPVQDLPALYTQAQAFLFPSLYEGFGLPVLEAMACGTPVIASNRTSIPEVAGPAALLVDPADREGWAAALIAVLQDGELRARLASAGRARSLQFSWEECARAHLAVYREVASTS